MTTWPRRLRTLLLTATSVVTIVLALVVVIRQRSTVSPVYGVVQVKAGLARHPGQWMGRTILVRGIVVTIHHSIFGAGLALSSVGPLQTTVLVPDLPALRHNEAASLSYIFNARQSSVLLVRVQRPDSLMSALERIPVLGTLLVRRRDDAGYTAAVYRLQLLTPRQSCLNNQCADAVLLDATP